MTDQPPPDGHVPLPAMDVASRAERARELLREHELDALVVTNLTNVRWLTGFTGSSATVWLDADQMVLVTDGRYADQAPAELARAGARASVVVHNDTVACLADAATQTRRVGLEADHVAWGLQQRIDTAITADVVPTDNLLVVARAVKDAGELARIRRAAAIADTALAQVAPDLAGATEREIALQLDNTMRGLGATNSAYETIVASGPNAALPHARPTDREIGQGDLVIIDVGALVDGYRSDMTRTFVIGRPDDEQRRQLDVVLEAQQAGVAAVRDGVDARAVDSACRTIIADAGWGSAFSHGTGHGVGLDIHEHPRLNSRTDHVLAAGMLVTVEPGVYLAGSGGVRWEDLLHVTTDGAEVLTQSPKNPVAT